MLIKKEFEQVVQIIYHQIGGHKFKVMTGAKLLQHITKSEVVYRSFYLEYQV